MKRIPEQVVLQLAPGPHAGAVAGQVALGLALRAGFPALLAERIRRDLARAVGEAGEDAELRARCETGRVTVELRGDGDWARRAATALEDHRPALRDGATVVVFRGTHRGALRAV